MNTEIDRIKVFLKQGYDLYIYGTGLWGRNVYHELRKQQIPIKGFVVTKKENIEKSNNSSFDTNEKDSIRCRRPGSCARRGIMLRQRGSTCSRQSGAGKENGTG